MGKGLPEQFLERLRDIVGASRFSAMEKMFVERPTTFRVNTLRATREAVMAALREHNIQVHSVPWYKDAFILRNTEKRAFTALPMYTEGRVYIQSLASMAPPILLAPQAGETVLDLTAAPGSKTSQMAAMMEKTGQLIANDNNKIRFFKLKHNMELLGAAGEDDFLTLRMEDGSHLCGEYKEYFDKILLDAPCSAEARFVAGGPKTYGYWSERKIKEMAFKQRKLLFSAWVALKPGGTLVYSTCTFAPEENEVQISKFLERFDGAAEALPAEIPGLKTLPPLAAWKGRAMHEGVGRAIRILPTAEIEGFFAAKIRKRA
jgi:16S rRNA (cytosine1407-C5)-methyltransferase